MPGGEKRKDSELSDLVQIRNLLILLLTKVGASSDEISLATGDGASTIRRDFPAKKIRRLPGL